MKGEWVYNSSYFSKEDCEKIVTMAMELPEVTPGMGLRNETKNQDYRRSRVRWVNPYTHPQFEPVVSEFWKFLTRINGDWFGFNVTHLPPLQFTEYKGEYLGEYKSHQDVFWLNDSPRHRKLSIILQLTDPSEYEGGNLILENVEQAPPADMIRKQGSLIAFPSFIYHKLEPVTSGTRHSLVAWFEGPKFQ